MLTMHLFKLYLVVVGLYKIMDFILFIIIYLNFNKNGIRKNITKKLNISIF